MYSTHNEGKSVNAERFTRTLTNLVNLVKDLDFYYVLLIFLANMLGLFL